MSVPCIGRICLFLPLPLVDGCVSHPADNEEKSKLLAVNKGRDPDGIAATVLRTCALELVTLLTHLFEDRFLDRTYRRLQKKKIWDEVKRRGTGGSSIFRSR